MEGKVSLRMTYVAVCMKRKDNILLKAMLLLQERGKDDWRIKSGLM